ncbi:hypothetical protein A3J61_01115 [Candidatus Nomurabacteria bacterium RIFCSPHIGHO2_02_FULL_38_15]|uniref:Uncharacterized protein n=1 Tax=Candidatus Nomurabacteria bacterium RIFCSPHIGHO2_02_FULL_38_15 TaxID=1801752 RepID=A0A1F6VSA1_9BACT|nr:MAG: hypothetical protein A3J61_01115 [Candidatus Nomurabacteria bacterium RIFCSPHIGHO2_02_FULL_38_15]
MDNTEIFQKIQNLEAKIDQHTEIINKVYKMQKIGLYTRYGYWMFLILIAFGAAYFISPFVTTLKDVYLGNSGILEILGSVSTAVE